MHALRTNNAGGRATTRSKVSNGTRLFANTDGRTSSARRFRDLVQSFEAEFDGDLCEADRSLIRQAATLLLKSEQMQEAVVRGEPVDSDALIRMASTAKRVLAAITAPDQASLAALSVAAMRPWGIPRIDYSDPGEQRFNRDLPRNGPVLRFGEA